MICQLNIDATLTIPQHHLNNTRRNFLVTAREIQISLLAEGGRIFIDRATKRKVGLVLECGQEFLLGVDEVGVRSVSLEDSLQNGEILKMVIKQHQMNDVVAVGSGCEKIREELIVLEKMVEKNIRDLDALGDSSSVTEVNRLNEGSCLAERVDFIHELPEIISSVSRFESRKWVSIPTRSRCSFLSDEVR